ncbi:hypothetical protein CNMCM8980_003042 [Aspergillus fumigatiaffinis]|nr:hypothetical protein CNMCM5878_007392 [Aspergillus fumigatiaffinis]KAF4220182.1 hypothetical protein CNMCM6457_002548 [Aspergillus fumigatiaffinis]KAF4236003.1 hypothetical protein CNMCM8980_003042 [Aspergillus fumigatiaffinis]
MSDSPKANVLETAESFASRQYDFLVVGGGTAGLALAARLSEETSFTIGILEAGQPHLTDPKILTPGLCGTLSGDPEYDWKFKTEHLNGRQIAWPRGRVLGGSSAINFMQVTYPTAKEINDWGALGNEHWSWDDLLPYYRKFQTFARPSAEVAKSLGTSHYQLTDYGGTGPIQVSFYSPHDLQDAWLKTFETLGHRMSQCPLSGTAIGGFTNPASVDPESRTRSYSTNAYYLLNATRSNMFVLTGAQVLKINFDATKDGQLMASGVSFLAQGIEYIVKARREVILSAGTVQSPQILELSGIGSEDVLSKHGINVLINNPGVGENLQDHALAALAYEVADPNLSLDSLRDPGLLKTALESFQTEMSGPFASGVQASAFLPIVEFVSERGKTELQTLLEDLPKGQESGGIKSQHSLLNQALLDPRESTSQLMLLPFQVHTESAHDQQALFNPSAAGAYITLTAHIARPYSRGHVHIRSPDPLDQPCIDPCYLSHPLDREILARHFRYLQTIARTEPLASKLATNGRTIPDGIPVDLDLASAKEEIKKVLTTQYHPIGTCAMMPLEKGGVVDAKLTVHGTVNLRVVDASVFPMQLRGNIQSTVYAIAEYAADMIKAKWVRSGKDSEGDLH